MYICVHITQLLNRSIDKFKKNTYRYPVSMSTFVALWINWSTLHTSPVPIKNMFLQRHVAQCFNSLVTHPSSNGHGQTTFLSALAASSCSLVCHWGRWNPHGFFWVGQCTWESLYQRAILLTIYIVYISMYLGIFVPTCYIINNIHCIHMYTGIYIYIIVYIA